MQVAYEDVTPYPLKSDQIVLRLRHGYSWREDGEIALSIAAILLLPVLYYLSLFLQPVLSLSWEWTQAEDQ